MKKVAVLIFIILTSTFLSQAQTTKGNWLVGGTLVFTSNTQESTAIGKATSIGFGLDPNIGYFLADNVAAGLKLSYQTNKFTVNNNTSKSSVFGIGPFARLYFLSPQKTVNVLAEASYQYSTTNPAKDKTNSFSFAAGPVVYFNSSVGLEFLVGYTNAKTEDLKRNIVQVGLGFQIHLDK